MNMLDPRFLRNSVDAAHQRGLTELSRSEIERIAEQELQNELVKKQAETILSHLPSSMSESTRKKDKYCTVLHMSDSDSNRLFGSYKNNKLQPEQLKGAAVLVWDACVKAGLNPELHFWHDGAGMYGGFDLVIPVPQDKRV